MSVSTATRRQNAGGRRARDQLVRTAERLFAENGVDAVPLRQIQDEAGMRNASAVTYHFGDKDGLIRAIIDARLERIDERRRAMLAELEAQDRLDDLRALVEVAVRPTMEEAGNSGYYFRFLAQLDRRGTLGETQASGVFRSAQRVIELQDRLAGERLPAAVVAHRRRLARHLVIGALAELEANGVNGPDEAWTADLIECVLALLTAPPPQQTLDALRAGDTDRSASAAGHTNTKY